MVGSSAAENTMDTTDTSVDFNQKHGQPKQSTSDDVDDEADVHVNELAKDLKSWLQKNRINQGLFAERYLKRLKLCLITSPNLACQTQNRGGRSGAKSSTSWGTR